MISEHECSDNFRTASDIEKYGLTVIIVEATDYLPSFAYSIGLWQEQQHPEIIIFGLSIETMHIVINGVADMVKNGQVIEKNKTYDDIFRDGRAVFLEIDHRNLSDYFGNAIDYYGHNHFSALQLVWTDRNDRFPWEEGFEDEFNDCQPLLDRNADFKFREAANLAVFTTKQWVDEQKPILRVVHDSEGDWQFLTGDQQHDDIRMVALEKLVKRDNTLNELFNLDYGESAEREYIGADWIRSNAGEEEE